MKQMVLKPLSRQLYGSILRRQEVSGLTLMETAYTPGVELPKHSHEFAYFCFVLQGAYSEVYGRRTRICTPSTLTFYSPGEVHSDSFNNARARCFNVQISPRWLDRVRKHSKVVESPTEFHGGALATLGMKLYKEFRFMDETSPLAIEGLMLEIIAEASRRAGLTERRKIPPRIERAREFLHAHFQESIRLDRIAGSVEAHPVYLAREFRRHYRCTVGEYVRRLRVEFACQRLSSSDEPLARIAAAAGFSDQSHFSRTVRSLTGMSPAEYRKASRPR